MELVLAHEADVAFAGRPPRDARLEARALHPNEHVLITAPDDPLAARAQVAPAELAGRTWLLREPGSGTRTVNEEFLAAAGLEAPTLTVGSNGAIRQAARAGLGISFVSRDAVADDLDGGLLAAIAVVPSPAPREWHVLRSRVGPLRPVVATFLDFVAQARSARAAKRRPGARPPSGSSARSSSSPCSGRSGRRSRPGSRRRWGPGCGPAARAR